MTIYVYPAIIEGDAATGYSVYFPDLPGCTSGGDNQTLAAINAADGLAAHIEMMLEDGEPLPAPTPIETMKGFSHETEIARLLVTARIGQNEPVA
jgi:predicted RNase H-like HicB family nuclease